MRTCVIEDCGKKLAARGWCHMHYKRWKLKGDPIEGTRPHTKNLEEAMAIRTVQQGECLVWTGSTTNDGYAAYGGSDAKTHGTRYVHRIVWERYMGEPIPEGFEIDHICKVRNCLNVEHLRLATRGEQVRNVGVRKESTTGLRGVYAKQNKSKRTIWYEVDFNGVRHRESGFASEVEASIAAEAKRRELYGKDYAG